MSFIYSKSIENCATLLALLAEATGILFSYGIQMNFMEEKTTSGRPDTDSGLNKGNPNAERTPIQERQPTNLIGGTAQSNFTDDQAGTSLKKNNADNKESSEPS